MKTQLAQLLKKHNALAEFAFYGALGDDKFRLSFRWFLALVIGFATCSILIVQVNKSLLSTLLPENHIRDISVFLGFIVFAIFNKPLLSPLGKILSRVCIYISSEESLIKSLQKEAETNNNEIAKNILTQLG